MTTNEDLVPVPLTRRDLEQILSAMENRGDHRNADLEWCGLYDRLWNIADRWSDQQT